VKKIVKIGPVDTEIALLILKKEKKINASKICWAGEKKATIDSRLCLRYATHDEIYVSIFEQNLSGVDAVVSAVTLLSLRNTYDAPWGPSIMW